MASSTPNLELDFDDFAVEQQPCEHHTPPNEVDKKRAEQATFRKRASTIFRRCADANVKCGAEFYVEARFRNRTYIYKSDKTDDRAEPQAGAKPRAACSF